MMSLDFWKSEGRCFGHDLALVICLLVFLREVFLKFYPTVLNKTHYLVKILCVSLSQAAGWVIENLEDM